MVFGMAYVSPARVLRASSRFLRWQIAATAVCVAFASATLMARSESPAAQLVEWWPFALSFAGIFINAGMVWQQLTETKRRVELLERDYVRKDVIVEQFNVLRSEIAGLRELLEDR
mgnify:CR=1 FL=1